MEELEHVRGKDLRTFVVGSRGSMIGYEKEEQGVLGEKYPLKLKKLLKSRYLYTY